MGIYVGLEATQGNLHYTDYTWYEIKGPKGDGVSYTAQTAEVGLTRTYTMYTSDGTPVGSFSVTDGAGAVSLVNGIAPDGDGDVSTVVGSVSDLGLTVGSATISDAYTALLDKQVLICPASDFAVGELPLFGGNRQTDGTIEIVKGGTDGWIEFHGRQSSVGEYRMCFTSSDIPSGTWVRIPGYVVAGTITKTDSASTLSGGAAVTHDGHSAQLVMGAQRFNGSYPASTYTEVCEITPAPKAEMATIVTAANGVPVMVLISDTGKVSFYPYGSAASNWVRFIITYFI
jgi:hypothetical protein